MYRIIVLLASVCLVFVGLGSVGAAPPAEKPLDVSHLQGRLAFPVFEGGTYNLYISKVDGSDRRLLIPQASQPDFNSDGSQIAYRSWNSEQRGIFTSPVEDIIPWNIQQKAVAESGRPVWSRDDKVIAFHSYEEWDRKPRIYYTGGDKEVYLPLRTDKSGRYIDLMGIDPDWMPDGSIVYTEKECKLCGIFRISLTGGLIARLTDQTGDEAPAVSPDGRRVAFMSTRDGVWDLYVVNADGSNLRRLTEDEHIDGLPTWAPDNKTLLFVSNRDGDWGIWAIDVGTRAMARLFALGGDIDGYVHAGTSRGWAEERIAWAP